jgi:hexosaminidase
MTITVDAQRYPLIPWPREVVAVAGDVRLGDPVALPILRDPRVGTEAYTLDIDASGVRVVAADERGAFYARQALRQLVRDDGSAPFVHIADSPRFRWRGLHLDVSRHFFPVSFIKRYIDLLAAYRLNVFHWHLTDDQGWRLEIKKYPRLTEVGGRRRETIVGHARRGPKGYDATPHGGFYTQEEVRDVVAHARERGVDVLPEIEIPGHSVAALVAYPQYACGGPPSEVRTTWGISDVVYCPTEPTFAFLQDVLGEVADLFPFAYIHIGGDEAPKTRWKECADAQEVMRREGLRDEEELQSWIIRRVEKIVHGLGRRIVGWDEILEGGLAPDATVMSWRGTEGGIGAANEGHDVVMCPQADLYFDHYQADPATEPLAIGGMTTLEDVYGHEPVPAALGPAEAGRVLGPQGCVWTEYIATPEDVERMTYPRALALAEIAWSLPADRDLAHFAKRFARERAWLDRMRVAYSRAWPS